MDCVLFKRRDVSTLERIICKLENCLYLLIIAPLVAFLPAPLAYCIACRRGDWAYQRDVLMRERLIRSLKEVLGNQLSDTERSQVIRDFFRRRSCEAIDMMRLAGKGRALARLVEIRGLEYIEEALAAGKGAVLCSAHFGFFNGAFSLLGAHGFPVTVVGDRRSSSDSGISPLERLFWELSVEKRMMRHRRRPNIEPQKSQVEAAIQITEILRANEVIAITIDVPMGPEDRRRAVSIGFLGRQALLLPGSVTLAQMTGSQVLVLVIHRSENWWHQILEILPVPLDGDVEAAFKHCVAMVEAPILQNLAYWNGWEDPHGLVESDMLSTC